MASDDGRVVRVVTLPVREVVEPDGRVIDTFRDAWRRSTDLANWCQLELVKHDVGRQPDAAKIAKYVPKMFPGGVSLYGHVNTSCPFRPQFDGAAGSMSAVVKAVEDTWRTHKEFGRFAVLGKGSARPAVFRFPYPWPVRSQELRIYRGAEGRPQASLTLPGGRVVVRLGDGQEFRRQLRQFDALLADVSRVKQAKVTGRMSRGKLVGADLRIVGAFDPGEAKGARAAVVRTDPNALLVVEVEGRQPWVLNRDDLRRLQAVRAAVRQRYAEDLKHEKRVPRKARRGMVQSLSNRCDKFNARIDTAVHQVAAQVAQYLHRAGVSTVIYDDGDKDYIPDGFPWAVLGDRVGYKLESAGVEVSRAKSATGDEGV